MGYFKLVEAVLHVLLRYPHLLLGTQLQVREMASGDQANVGASLKALIRTPSIDNQPKSA
jgi:hypothetical protein